MRGDELKQVDIEAARRALYRFCKGEQKMCVPAQNDDDDFLIDMALNELELAREKIRTYEQVIKNQNEINRQHGY